MTKTIAIIPARGGSKRMPKKNVQLFGGIPLVVHSILYAKKHDFIDDVYVSTDDAEIKKIALKFGALVIDRPSEISGDYQPTITALKHAVENLEDIENVILLQPTNPLRPIDLLQNAFYVFQEKNFDSLFTVSQSHRKLGKINNDKFEPFNYKIGQRSQDMEPLFYENGLLYITKRSLILEDVIISEKAFPYQVNHIFMNVDIDTKEDFEYAEYLYYKYCSVKP